MDQIVTPPASLPVMATDATLAAAVVEELERAYLWRAIVHQTRRILIDGDLPARIEIEPVTEIVSLTRYTPDNAAEVIDAADYMYVSRDPAGTIIAPHHRNGWPKPERDIGSFAITYSCGWQVTPETAPGTGDAVNEVPASVRLMVERAIAFREGSGGLARLTTGAIKIDFTDSYQTDRLPAAIGSIGRAYQYRPGIIAAEGIF